MSSHGELPPRARRSGVLLVQPGREHGEAFLRAARTSRALHGTLVRAPLTRKQYSAWLERAARDDYFPHLLVERTTGELAGVANLGSIVRGLFQSGYLGYYAFVAGAGRGLMRAGIALVLDRAYGELGLHRVEANIQPENVRSSALVMSLRFRLEGYSPRYLKIAGRWRDHERYALLAEEWR